MDPNLRVNTTWARRVQTANVRRGYQEVFSQLRWWEREDDDIRGSWSYSWGAMEISPVNKKIDLVLVTIWLTFVLEYGPKDAAIMRAMVNMVPEFIWRNPTLTCE